MYEATPAPAPTGIKRLLTIAVIKRIVKYPLLYLMDRYRPTIESWQQSYSSVKESLRKQW